MLSTPKTVEGSMYRQLDNPAYGVAEIRHDSLSIARSGELDALVALERIGTRASFSRNEEIYAEGDQADCWYKVVSGTVRVCKILADGRRHIAEFCFGGDCFGADATTERVYSAEAVDDVIVMRFQRKATERAIDQNPAVARLLRDAMLGQCARPHIAARPYDGTRARRSFPFRDVQSPRPDED